MRVRAVAAPSAESNAVGSVELTCTPDGLVMHYISVSAYRPGYAPTAATRGTEVTVPWPEVDDVERTRRGLFVKLASKRTPHNQLALVHFIDGDGPSPEELKKRRGLLRAGVAAAALSTAVGVIASVERWAPGSGFGIALGLAAASAVGLMLVGLLGERIWLRPKLSHAQVVDLFIAELRHYRPKPVHLADRPAPPPPLDFNELLRALPRSTTAIVIVLTSTSLAAIITSNWIILGGPPSRTQTLQAGLSQPPPPRREAPEAPVMAPPSPSSGPASPPTGAATSAAAPDAPADSRTCSCPRAESVLWESPFPKLSTLLIDQQLRSHKDHQHLALELGLVNNSKESVKAVGLTVQFYENSGKTPTKDRHLFYEGTLRPGKAVKWHVEARGDSYAVTNPHNSALTATDIASADALADLLQANHRPVRLHGAMLLGFLGDERAKGAALKLREASREREASYLDRVLATQRDTIPCQLHVENKARQRQVELCVFNQSARDQSRLGLKLRALDRVFDHRNPVSAPPTVIAENAWRLPGVLPPNQGRWVSVLFDTDNVDGKVAETVEAFVDEYDSL